jgi:RHS repeat-associated protein
MMTSTSGAVLWSQRQKAFGEMIVDGSSTIVNNLRFPGQYFDAETGAHQNFWRDFDPSSGRYLQGDPVKFAGGMNFYAYALGAPLRFIDAMGLLPKCTDIPLAHQTQRRRTGQRRNVTVGDEYSRIESLRVEFGAGPQPGSDNPSPGRPRQPPPICIDASVGTVIVVRQFYRQQTGEEEVIYIMPVQRYCEDARRDDCGNLTLIRFNYRTEKELQRQWEGFTDEIPGRRIRYEIPLGGPSFCIGGG